MAYFVIQVMSVMQIRLAFKTLMINTQNVDALNLMLQHLIQKREILSAVNTP